MRSTLEMAIEAGAVKMNSSLTHPEGPTTSLRFPIANRSLERFIELVRADESEKYKWDIHSCGPTCDKAACVATRKAVAEEREACAKVCEKYGFDNHCGTTTDAIAAAIRARGSDAT